VTHDGKNIPAHAEDQQQNTLTKQAENYAQMQHPEQDKPDEYTKEQRQEIDELRQLIATKTAQEACKKPTMKTYSDERHPFPIYQCHTEELRTQETVQDEQLSQNEDDNDENEQT
jgi:hypothetical protein